MQGSTVDCRNDLTAKVDKFRNSGWIVESSQGDEYLLRKKGRSVFPFRLLSFRGLMWCAVTIGIAALVWLSVVMFYSWWAWSLPLHRDRTIAIRIVITDGKQHVAVT